MKTNYTLELMRHNVTPREFVAYVNRMLKKHGINEFIDFYDFVNGEKVNGQYWNTSYDNGTPETRPAAAEKIKSLPYDQQTYIKWFDGSIYNQITEFQFDDEKRGFGYYYIISTEVEPEQHETEKAAEQPEKSAPKKTNYKFNVLFDTARAAVEKDVAVFHEPRGNDKTGEIPAFNLLPGVTCSGEACAHCMQEGCYAVKNLFRGGYNAETNKTFRAWIDNTVLAKNHLNTLEKALDKWLTEEKPVLFRIHSSGDFFGVEYARMWKRLAVRHPGTRFLAFTKQWEVVRSVKFYTVKNFELVLSGWTGISIPEDLRKHYRCAWCNDGFEKRIPADAIRCPGNCEECRLCWNLSEIGKDTYFDKH